MFYINAYSGIFVRAMQYQGTYESFSEITDLWERMYEEEPNASGVWYFSDSRQGERIAVNKGDWIVETRWGLWEVHNNSSFNSLFSTI